MSWRTFCHRDIFLKSWRTLWHHDELFDIMTHFLHHSERFDVMMHFLTYNIFFDIMTYFWCHTKLFDVMPNFLMSSQTFWHHMFLTSWQTFWSNEEYFDVFFVLNFLTSGHIFDVIAYFLTLWRIFDLMTNFLTLYNLFLNSWTFWWHDKLFWSHDQHFDIFYVMNFLTSWTFWCHGKLFDVMPNFLMSSQTFWHHNMFLTSWQTFWSNEEHFDVMVNFMMYFWCHDKLFDVMTYFDKLFDVMKFFFVFCVCIACLYCPCYIIEIEMIVVFFCNYKMSHTWAMIIGVLKPLQCREFRSSPCIKVLPFNYGSSGMLLLHIHLYKTSVSHFLKCISTLRGDACINIVQLNRMTWHICINIVQLNRMTWHLCIRRRSSMSPHTL